VSPFKICEIVQASLWFKMLFWFADLHC